MTNKLLKNVSPLPTRHKQTDDVMMKSPYPPPFPVRLQWSEYNDLKELSKSLGKSMSETIRLSIRDALDKYSL